MVDIEPLARGDKADQRLRHLGDQRQPRRRRDILAREQRFANGGEVAKAFDHAIDRERRDLSLGVFREHEADFRRADFGDGGRDRARQAGAARDRRLHAPSPVATASTRSASTNSGDSASTGAAICG